MRARVRKSAAYSIPFLLLCAILIWVGPRQMSPAAPAAPMPDDRQGPATPRGTRQLELPSTLPPTGGPYVDAESIRLSGLRQATGRGAVNPQAESVRFMTYGEAVDAYRTGWSMTIDPYREVYVVYVPGRITAGHHAPLSYARSYYIYDATTGKLVQWGATDLPEPLPSGRQ
jgi:hypothetical protein